MDTNLKYNFTACTGVQVTDNGTLSNYENPLVVCKDNINDTLPPSDILPSRTATAIAVAIMIPFSIEALLGIFWITYIVCKHRKLWNAINVFIVSLCVNDVMNIVFTQVFVIQTYITLSWLANDLWCQMLPEFSILLSGCSVWHSALIAIHRYLVVVKNNFYQSMSKSLYVVAVLFLTRIIPLLVVVPSFFARMSQYVPKLLRCIISSAYATRTLVSISVIIIIPSLIVVVCFATIFIYVRNVQKNMQFVQTSVRREIQITKMFGVTFLIFVIGYLIYGIVRVVDNKKALDADIYVFISVLHHIGTCLNPVIYGLMNQQIRNTCLITIGKDQQIKAKKKKRCKKIQNNHGRQSLDTRSYLQCSSESDHNQTPKTSLTTAYTLAVPTKANLV